MDQQPHQMNQSPSVLNEQTQVQNDSEPESPLQAAQSDFKVSLVLLVIGLALFIHTLNFPMSGSYGGVENQWFISPALFPLMVCFLLVVCTNNDGSLC